MNAITWNMHGTTGSSESKWNTDVKRLFTQAGINVACLQEAGTPPLSAVSLSSPYWLPNYTPPKGTNSSYLMWNVGTSLRPFYIYILWLECDPIGHHCNLAIASTLPPVNCIYINPGVVGGRPCLGISLLPSPGNYVNFFTLHAFSPDGNDAPGLLNNINAVEGSSFIAGDYNRGPSSWDGGYVNSLCPHDDDATNPDSRTNLNYAFKFPGPIVKGQIFNSFVESDHSPVLYRL